VEVNASEIDKEILSWTSAALSTNCNCKGICHQNYETGNNMRRRGRQLQTNNKTWKIRDHE